MDEEVEQAYKIFMRELINKGGRHTSVQFIELFRKEHPTLQQGFFRLVSVLVESLVKYPPHVDGRNEGMMEFIKKIDELPYSLPLI